MTRSPWHSLLALLVIWAAPALGADIRVTGESSAAAAVSGRGVPSLPVTVPKGQILSGLSFAETGAICALEVEHRTPDRAQSGTGRFDACRSNAPPADNTLRARPGHAITEIRACLDQAGRGLEGIVITTTPDFCVADPTLWVERETGAPFRLRVRTEDGFLRPPSSYARPCSWSVQRHTVSDARPGCGRWQPVSSCPPGFAMTGFDIAMTGGAVTGLRARCNRLSLSQE